MQTLAPLAKVLRLAPTACLVLFVTGVHAQEPSNDPLEADVDVVVDEVDGELNARIAALIEQMGDPDFATREQAEAELSKIGRSAFGALHAATQHEDVEIAARARYLVRSMEIIWTTPDDPPRVRELMGRYSDMQVGERLAVVQELSSMENGEGVPALCRLAQFESVSLVQREAALALLWMRPALEDARLDRKWNQSVWYAAIKQNLKDTTAAPAKWVLFGIESQRNRPGAAKQFEDVIAKLREDVSKRAQANNTVVQGDIRAIGMMDIIPDERFALKSLLYLLADAQRAAGLEEKSKATAEQALKVFPEGESIAASASVVMGVKLQGYGAVDWAIAEFQRAMERLSGPMRLDTALHLSEMLHDQLRDAEAADVRFAVVDPDAEDDSDKSIMKEGPDGLLAIDRKVIMARAYYFQAVQAKRDGDIAKHKELLEKSLASDPNELDSLIARHRLTDVDEAYGAETETMIDAAVDVLRQAVREDPTSPSNHNQLAWLLACTDRSLDEALMAATTATKLRPNTSAYLDTLAHVLAAQDDFDKAVEYQTLAVRLDPQSKLLEQALKRFQEQGDSAAKGEETSDEAMSEQPTPPE